VTDPIQRRSPTRAAGARAPREYVSTAQMGRLATRQGWAEGACARRVALLAVGVALCACHTGEVSIDDHGAKARPHNPLAAIHDPKHAGHGAKPPENDGVSIPPRTPHLSGYPCMEQCHAEREPDRQRRELEAFHTLKRVMHGNSDLWCDFCHDLENLDGLRLFRGDSVGFDAAPTLCGQCHGDKLRDFRAGIHGLQTGHFRGPRERRSCTACHDPHAPRRPSFVTLPPPALRKGVP